MVHLDHRGPETNDAGTHYGVPASSRPAGGGQPTVPVTRNVGGLNALLTNRNVLVLAPAAPCALKVTEIWQLRPGATAVVQLPRDTENAVVSSTVTEVIVSGTVPSLVTLTVLVVDLPAFTFPRSSVVGFSEISAAVPVPDRLTVRAAAGSLLPTPRVAVRTPGPVGANRTATTQLPPGATEAAGTTLDRL